MTNTNPETGIRYGIISANALDPEIIDEIQTRGKDLHHEGAMNAVEADIRCACEGYLTAHEVQDVVDLARSYVCTDVIDEPIHSFEIDGVKGQTTWLGGALMVWIFDSPHTGVFRLCSPCVPNCCDLNSPVDVLRDKVGEIGYDVPPDWRYTE